MRQNCTMAAALLSAALLVIPAGCATTAAPAPAAPQTPAAPVATADAKTPELKSQKDRASYCIGVDMARNFKRQEVDVDVDLVARGMKDIMSGKELLLSDSVFTNTMMTFGSEMVAKRGKQARIVEEENKSKSEAFLAENKTKEGVVVLPSGLQYKILKAGDGKKPGPNDTVECHLKGTALSGAVFQDTHSGEPVPINVADGGIIAGLREALRLMPVGSKWELFIPSRLAYLGQGMGKHIGPNAMLTYEVEVLAIQ